MRIDEERGSCASDHIQRMKNLFSEEEMSLMLSNETEIAKWLFFTLLYCPVLDGLLFIEFGA